MNTYLVYNIKGEIVFKIQGEELMHLNSGATIAIVKSNAIIALIPSQNISAVIKQL